jgi:hypothetical protein
MTDGGDPEEPSLQDLIGLWLERIWDESVDPAEEAERIVADAPERLRVELRRELAEMLDLARSTVQQGQLRPGASVGAYVLVERLGAGSTGVVWSARRHVEGSEEPPRFALKLLHPVYLSSASGQRRVHAEIEAARALTGPGLVPVVDLVESGDLLALVMPLVGSGRTLADELAQAREAGHGHDRRQILQDLLPAIRGLAQLHASGIAHLDFKPGNLLREARGALILADLGLIKALDEPTWTRSHQLIGTPAYMSPELARGDRRHAGPEADVWAVGVTLYEALNLSRPFEGASTAELLREIEVHRPRRLSTPSDDAAVTGFSARAWRIILRCLEKEPARRYPSAAELLADLERLLGSNEPVGVSRMRQWALGLEQRRKEVVITGLAVMVAATSLLVALRFRDLEAEASAQLERAERALSGMDRILSLTREAALGLGPETNLQDLAAVMELAMESPTPSGSAASILGQLAQLCWDGTVTGELESALELSQAALEAHESLGGLDQALLLAQRASYLERSGSRMEAAQELAQAAKRFEESASVAAKQETALFLEGRATWCRARARRLQRETGDDLELRERLETARRGLGRGQASPWALRLELELLLFYAERGSLDPGPFEQLQRELADRLGGRHPWCLDAFESELRARLDHQPDSKAKRPVELARALRTGVESRHGANHPWTAMAYALESRALAQANRGDASLEAAQAACRALGAAPNASLSEVLGEATHAGDRLQVARLRTCVALAEALAKGGLLDSADREALEARATQTLGPSPDLTRRVRRLL